MTILSDPATARTVAIAQEAARRLDQPGRCAAYLQAALAGDARIRIGAALALLVRGGAAPLMHMAHHHLVDAVQRVALAEVEGQLAAALDGARAP